MYKNTNDGRSNGIRKLPIKVRKIIIACFSRNIINNDINAFL